MCGTITLQAIRLTVTPFSSLAQMISEETGLDGTGLFFLSEALQAFKAGGDQTLSIPFSAMSLHSLERYQTSTMKMCHDAFFSLDSKTMEKVRCFFNEIGISLSSNCGCGCCLTAFGGAPSNYNLQKRLLAHEANTPLLVEEILTEVDPDFNHAFSFYAKLEEFLILN